MTFSATVRADSDKIISALSSIDGALLAGYVRVLKRCNEKNGGYAKITIETPRKARTLPQNAKFHAMCQELAVYTGNDMEDVKIGVKERAMSRGYPHKLNEISGNIQPKSSADVDTSEMAILIETLYEVAAEFGYVFKEV